MSLAKSIFVVSLDFESYWGVRDMRNSGDYWENIYGIPEAVKQIVTNFDFFDIHATWATVGFLFCKNWEELSANLPDDFPTYDNPALNPYRYLKELSKLESDVNFASDLIDLIINYTGQEIGTHTFSHYYCRERGQTLSQFASDLSSAIKIAQKRQLKLNSLVFPKNQCNENYLHILNELGINCYRGNQDCWLYNSVNVSRKNILKRLLRLLDTYINIFGYHTYSLASVAQNKPYNIPSSLFLRPLKKKIGFLERLRLKRIKKSMSYAAEHKQIFHLWWHPHNFGRDLNENISFLREILEHFDFLRRREGMCSLNMGEVCSLIGEE